MQELAKDLGVVIPVSFFEEANNAHYNSVVVIDADGTDVGLYRKSHIPDGPGKWSRTYCRSEISSQLHNEIDRIPSTWCFVGYQEKFYFNPGDTGFKVNFLSWSSV